MAGLIASILLAVELGGGFGTAGAVVVSTTSESMVVELEVEVESTPDTVVAHLALPAEDQVTIPLLPRGNQVYGVTTELKPANYQVVFEAVGESNTQSDPVSLSDLGAELGSVSDAGAEEEEETSPETNRWLWLGVALGAASLSALAFWVLGGRDDEDEVEQTDQASPEAPPEDISSEDSSSGDDPLET